MMMFPFVYANMAFVIWLLSIIVYAVYQPISANYKKEMVELGDLAETLVLALTLVENQLPEKLWVIKTLQHLSSSG